MAWPGKKPTQENFDDLSLKIKSVDAERSIVRHLHRCGHLNGRSGRMGVARRGRSSKPGRPDVWTMSSCPPNEYNRERKAQMRWVNECRLSGEKSLEIRRISLL